MMKRLLLALFLAASPVWAMVSNTATSTTYTTAGSTQDFLIPFMFLDNTHITVTVGGITQTQGINYSVTGSGFAENTGNVHLTAIPTPGLPVVISRTTPPLQPTALPTNGKFLAKVHEHAWDRLELQIQERTLITPAAPLPVALGGSGGAPPNCGAGVLTSNGTNFSCVTLSGLAPPGTTGVLLQTVTPGSAQVGHLNINGTGSIGVVAAGQYNTQGNTNSTSFYNSGTGLSGGTPLFKFDVAQSVGTTPYNNTQPYIRFYAQGSRWMDIMLGRIDLSPLDAGNGGAWSCPVGSEGCITGRWLGLLSSGTAIITDTKPFAVPNGSALLAMRNNNVAKFQINGDGSIPLVGGITSSGAISGTTGTFTGGTTIGTSGTAISGSFRQVGTLTPGAILGGSSASMTLTVTNAVAGADCVVTPPAGGMGVFTLSCWITSSTCNIGIGNPTAGSLTGPAGTYACRVFNP